MPYKHDIQINLNVRGLKPSATLAINELSNQLLSEGRKVYKLGLGQSPFPVPDPVVKSLQKHADEKDYLDVRGLKRLREAIAGFNKDKGWVDHSSEHIVVGPGSKELLFLLQLVYYGDLLIPTPSWVSYAPQAKIIGRNIHWIPTQKENYWLLTPEELEKICVDDPTKPRLLILNYPSNPTGYTYKKKQLKSLAQVARKYNVIVVADEIYGLLHHDFEHVSIASYYPEGTILSGGISKWCGAGGWRLGFLSFPERLTRLAETISVAASETFTSTSAPIQHAAVSAFMQNPELDNYLDKACSILKVLGNSCNSILNETGINNLPPHGGFYLFPDFSIYKEKLAARSIHTNAEMCSALLQDTGVAVLPGSEFGRPDDEFSLRLSYVNFDGKKAIKAAEKGNVDDAFIKKYCKETLEAIRTMRDWIIALG